MGMGEPLLNMAALTEAIAVFTDKAGFALSPRRITVSTCGIPDGIRALADLGLDLRLAVSLTTADEEKRRRLMPLAGRFPLSALRDALLYHLEKRGKRITLEVVLLGGINTGAEDAQKIAAFAKGLSVMINVIAWNPVPGLSFEGAPIMPPTRAEVVSFIDTLVLKGMCVEMRNKKGNAVGGACGQLGFVGNI
jgi:23S rRNA (adenine2503-C2)-methyltransferase